MPGLKQRQPVIARTTTAAANDMGSSMANAETLAPSPASWASEPVAPLSLRRNFSWTLTGNLVYAGCQWGMFVVLAKAGTPELAGQFALSLAITAPVILFSNLALRAVQATDTEGEFRFGDYFALRLVTTALAVLVIAAISFAFYRQRTGLVIFIIGLAKAFEAISDLIYGLLQKHERMDRVAKLQVINGLFSLGAFVLTLWLTNSLCWGAAALASVWGLRLAAWDFPSALWVASGQQDPCGIRPRWEGPTLARLAWLALPLGLVTVLISLNVYIPRYFIEYHLGHFDLGIFAALAYLVMFSSQVVNALGQSASPRLARYYRSGNVSAYRRLLAKLILIGIGIGVLCLLTSLSAGDQVLRMVYSEEYARHSDVLIVLMIFGVISYINVFLGHGMTAAGYFKTQPAIAAFSVLSTTSACALLIPGYGILGAAWAVLIGSAVQLLGYLCCNRSIWSDKLHGSQQYAGS